MAKTTARWASGEALAVVKLRLAEALGFALLLGCLLLFLSLFTSLPFDDRAADIYGRIRADLMARGQVIGLNDLLIAAIALELSHLATPPEIHFGWSDESPVVANLGFLFFGEGNVPWLVRELIRKAQPDPARQPRVVIG